MYSNKVTSYLICVPKSLRPLWRNRGLFSAFWFVESNFLSFLSRFWCDIFLSTFNVAKQNLVAKNVFHLLRHKGLKDLGTHIKYEVTLFEYILSVNFQSVLTSLRRVKFRYSEKAAQFCEISTLDLTVCCKRQILIGDFTKFCGLLTKPQL